MPYTKKDKGKIVGGRFEQVQPGLAEDYITEEDWQAHVANSAPTGMPFASPVQRLFKEIQKPGFPWPVFYSAAQQSLEFQAGLTLLLDGLQAGFSIEFVTQRFQELITYLRTHPELPQITTAHLHEIRRAVNAAGLDPDNFITEPTSGPG